MLFTSEFINVLKKEFNSNNTPLLLGPPGIGKSSLIEDLAKDMHTEIFTVPCNQLADKADLTGARLVPVTYKEIIDGKEVEVQDYEQKFYPHTAINQAIHYAKEHPTETPILFMDEINRTTQDVTSACLSLVTSRSIGCRSLPSNLKIVLAGNDKGNVIPLDKASITRFSMYSTEPDIQTYLGLDQNLNPFIKKVLQAHPDTLMGEGLPTKFVDNQADEDNNQEYNIEDILDEGTDMYQLTTPRTITKLSYFLNNCTNDELKKWMITPAGTNNDDTTSFLQEILESHTGRTKFTAYLTEEIMNSVDTIDTQGAVFKVPKPNIYDTLEKQPNMTDLIQYIEQMNDKDKSGCLVYAMSQNNVEQDIIFYLTKAIEYLTQDDSRNLGLLVANNLLPDENLRSFYNANTDLTHKWQAIFN